MAELHESTNGLLRAFIEAELKEFQIKPENFEGYVQKYLNSFRENLSKLPAVDYIRVESLSNLGLLERALILSGKPYLSGANYRMSLPPSPKGSISCYYETN